MLLYFSLISDVLFRFLISRNQILTTNFSLRDINLLCYSIHLNRTLSELVRICPFPRGPQRLRSLDTFCSPRNPKVILETEHLVKSWHSPARKVSIFEGAARVQNLVQIVNANGKGSYKILGALFLALVVKIPSNSSASDSE